MNFFEAFPLRLWLNLGRREDRRVEMRHKLAQAGISAERFPAVDAAAIRLSSHKLEGPLVEGYESVGRYALALTKRLAIRNARKMGASAVLLLEDDVIFHPNFLNLVAEIDLPDDWGIFYFGATHTAKPEWHSPRVVRVRSAVDNHAIAINAKYYSKILQVLDRHGITESDFAAASDRFISQLASEIPTYACYPNLAWQEKNPSDLMGKSYSLYTSDGKQTWSLDSVDDLLPEMIDQPFGKFDIKLALLFLVRSGVNHPNIWSDFIASVPGRTRIFCHSKEDIEVTEHELYSKFNFVERVETDWGDVSLVKATRNLLLEALRDESLTHFVLLSESCVPIRSLGEIINRLSIDPRSQFNFASYAQEASKQKKSRVSSAPTIPLDCWRFQSQWWLMNRVAATLSVQFDFTTLFAQVFAADECYFATVLVLLGYPLDGEVRNTRSTWSDWKGGHGSPSEFGEVDKDKALAMIDSGAFFARKFSAESDIARYCLHGTPPPLGVRSESNSHCEHR